MAPNPNQKPKTRNQKLDTEFAISKQIAIFAALNNKLQMIIVPIKENESIDKALKKFKKKFERTGVVRELRRRQTFEKPSVERRQEIIHAKYRDLMKRENTL